MKKSLAVMLALIMVLCMIPTTAFAASNSTVVLHPSFNHTVTGVKVKVGDKIDGHSITKISGYDITVDLGKYNVNNGTFRLPYAKDIWEGVDNNKVDYISWAGSGSNRRSEGASALLANGKNTAYYYFKGAPTLKTFTLKYDANGGTGAPATQTYTASSQYENSHTFTISSNTPTREGYEFKGWAETPNATTATRQPGGSIVVTGTTTLYAVWANHEHKDENGDGYCDTDHECMHEKDQDGYCIVDGCTHPHEGDGACCPKKSDNKPERPEPENTTKPVAGLTGKEVVRVECTTTNSSHAANTYPLIAGSYTVGEVSDDKEKGYTCEITVEPGKYVEAYNTDISVDHTLAPAGQAGTIHLKYDKEAQNWQLANPSGVPVVFNVKCDNTQPPLDTITIEVSKTWHDDSGAVAKPEKITVNLLKNGTVVENAPIMPDNEDTWFHRFDNMPANDSNGNPINYTVKEENIPAGWTPYYWTADKLIFQIHNVPTENTREIKVTKKVSGEGADTTKEFDFKVTLLQDLDGNGEIGVGTHPLSGTYTFGGVTFTNGVATFKLKDGESFEITGIPSHVQYLPLQYKVEEIAPSGYTVKVNDKAGNSINGDFTGDKTVDITFENVKESGTNPTHSPSTDPSPTPTPTPGGGNGGGGHWHPTTTPVPVIVIPPKTGDMTIWQSILHFLGIR